MRNAGKAVGGYFPTPSHLIPRIASLVEVEWHRIDGWSSLVVVDPCAGDGAAVFRAMDAWASVDQRKRGRARFYGAELERGRASGLATRAALSAFGRAHATTLHADGLRIDVGERAGVPAMEVGASILYLNPPYDTDPQCGRLEERFLRAWAPRVAVGGALLFVVPFASLAASADTLGRYFGDLACFRFPGDDFAAFRQVVLVARRLPPAHNPDAGVRLQAILWSRAADTIPELPAAPRPVCPVRPARHGFELWRSTPVRAEALRAAFRPWASTSRSGRHEAVVGILPPPSKALLRAEYPVAMPPRPSHIAAALAAGVYSGAEVEPDDAASGLPPALLKATFDRKWVEREEKTNPKGEVTGVLEVQAPQLCITALDLRTYAYHDLEMSPEASGSTSLERFTAGDLLARYGRSLLSVLRDRCPVLHDPFEVADEIPLPTLARPPFRAQAHAAMAAVKLFERSDGTQPLLLGELGAGKTGVAIQTALARGARTLLVMCPPHLLTSWAKQLAAVIGDRWSYEVFTLDSVQDVDAFAAWRHSQASQGRIGVALLSREKAKLGHAWTSITTPTCPTCGALLGPEKSAGERARRRLTCEAVARPARNVIARIVERLAVILAPRWVDHPAITGAVSPRFRALASAANARRAKVEPTGKAAEASAAIVRGVARAARAALDVTAATSTPYEWQTALCDFVYRAVGALGDDATTLDVAEHALTFRMPADRSDYAGANRVAQVRIVALGLCLMVRDPEHRARRDALVVSLCEGLRTGAAATDYREAFATKAAEIAGGGPTPRSDHWYTIKRADGGGVVVDVRGDKRRLVGALDGLPDALRSLDELSAWGKGTPCGGALYQPETGPAGIREALAELGAVARGEVREARTVAPVGLRRVPLASYIARRHRRLFDFMVADEAHELSSEVSAQGRSATRLMAAVPEVIHLTGSSSNGYARSLFTMLWNASPRFRTEFRRDEEGRFVESYGLKKRLKQQVDKDGKVIAFGAHSDRVQVKYTDKGDAPGVLPLLILRHVLPIAVTIQKADLKMELPPHEEVVITVTPDDDLRQSHALLTHALIAQVKKDAFSPLTGKLWGALGRLPTHADRATADTGNWNGLGPVPSPMIVEALGVKGGVIPKGAYVAAYPESALWCAHQPVAIALPFDPKRIMAKERALIAFVADELAHGRRVMVHPWHDDVGVRLARILAEALGEPVARLDAGKVIPAKREDWIDREVVGKGRRVMVVNPVAVQTGLNNLVWFQTAAWFENPGCNPVVYDQASGRIDRIGKTAPSKSAFFLYDLPSQKALHRLLMHKAGVLRGVDGLDGEAALEAAGASGDLAFAGMGLGRELYALLTGETA
jgi:Uncharacterised methyltransferase family (DUF6094)